MVRDVAAGRVEELGKFAGIGGPGREAHEDRRARSVGEGPTDTTEGVEGRGIDREGWRIVECCTHAQTIQQMLNSGDAEGR